MSKKYPSVIWKVGPVLFQYWSWLIWITGDSQGWLCTWHIRGTITYSCLTYSYQVNRCHCISLCMQKSVGVVWLDQRISHPGGRNAGMLPHLLPLLEVSSPSDLPTVLHIRSDPFRQVKKQTSKRIKNRKKAPKTPSPPPLLQPTKPELQLELSVRGFWLKESNKLLHWQFYWKLSRMVASQRAQRGGSQLESVTSFLISQGFLAACVLTH